MKRLRRYNASKYMVLGLIGLACSALNVPLQAQTLRDLLFSSSSRGEMIKTQLASIEVKLDSTPHEANQELAAVLPLLQKANYGLYWGKYHELKGKIAFLTQDPENAIKNYFKAAQEYKKSRNYQAQSKIYLALGDIFHHQWNHQKAIDYYLVGLNILHKYPQEDWSIQLQILEQLGLCNLELNSYYPALKYLKQAKALAEKNSVQPALCKILRLIGQTYMEQHQYELANQVLKQAQMIADKQHLPALEMTILDQLCRVSLEFGRYRQAKFFAFKKRTIAQTLRDSNCINLSNYLLAKAYLAENLLDSALSYNTIALSSALDQNRDTTKRDIWIQQGDILAKQNRAYPAILALENAQRIEDNIASSAQRLKAEKLRQEMTIHRAEKQLQQLFKAQFLRERYIRYGMFSAFLLAALISLYYLFKVKIRQKANLQLKIQNTQIESQKNELEQLSQVKDQLLAVISHDLRSPLWAIQAVLDTLNEPDLSPLEQKHWLELLHQQTAKTSVMLENLLYWARIQMNSYQPVNEEFKLQPIVEDLSESIQFIFAEKEVRIKNEISPSFTLYSDPGMIRMALRNIIANAVKFSHAGQEVEVHAQQEKNGCTIQIVDYGIGMNEEQLHKALNGQLSRFGTKGEVGSGMGLSLVRQFIENQGGKLIGQAQVNQGCVFTITLPSQRA